MKKDDRQDLALGKSTRQFIGVGAPCASEALPIGRVKSVSDLAPLLALALAACGGGGGGGGASNPPTPSSGNGGNPPPPPPPQLPPPQLFMLANEIPVALYENHPTNKPVTDLTPRGQSLADATLPQSMADNDLFQLNDDGRIWWQASPDNDGVYTIRINHDNNEQGYTEVEVTVADLEIELTPERWAADTTEVEGFSFTYEQVMDILPDNDFVQYLLRGFAYALPDEGPLIITWSIILPSSDLSLQGNGEFLPDTATQEKIDAYRANIKHAFAEYEAAANLQFVEVADSDAEVGMLRFFFSPVHTAGVARSVDLLTSTVWLGGDESHAIYVHEIGHALSFKHPYLAGGSFGGRPETRREQGYSVMTQALDPHLLPNDIAALQFLYGAPDTDFDGLQARLEEIGITPEIL